jgi:hypothetical protein
MAVGMERVSGKMANVIPRFGLEVAYTPPSLSIEHFSMAKKAAGRSAHPTNTRGPEDSENPITPIFF